MNWLRSHPISGISRRRFFQNAGRLSLSGGLATLGVGVVSNQQAHAAATTNRTSWVHGNAGVIQSDTGVFGDPLIVPTYAGPALSLVSNNGYAANGWIHFPVPIHHDGLTLQLMGIQILFDAQDPSTVLDAIGLFDGPNNIAGFSTSQQGNHFTSPYALTFGFLHTMQHGLGISLHFSAIRTSRPLLIASVGASFYDS